MTTGSPVPVLATDRVSDVLARDEALLEVFVGHAPHFSKLRNRTMRRVMARLVTVEQAARMAGVPVNGLLTAINDALGVPVADRSATPDEPAQPAAPPEAQAPVQTHPPDAALVVLDVRAELRAGHEPFSAIMRAVGMMEQDEVLHLRTTFEPVPLFHVLAKRGFTHEVTEHGPEDWSVWFWRPAAGSVPEPESPSARAAEETMPEHSADGTPLIWLDVRGMEPPEPMLQTLTTLESLPEGHELIQLNVRVPRFLLPVLDERGFEYEVDESKADRVLVHIRRR